MLYKDEALSRKIDTFLSRKAAEYPELAEIDPNSRWQDNLHSDRASGFAAGW